MSKRNKIAAFSLIEILSALAISSVVLSTGALGYQKIHQLTKKKVSSSQKELALSSLEHVLIHDITRAGHVELSDGVLGLEQEGMRIEYVVENDRVLRIQKADVSIFQSPGIVGFSSRFKKRELIVSCYDERQLNVLSIRIPLSDVQLKKIYNNE